MKFAAWMVFLLLACAPSMSAERAPLVFLSHFYVTLDQATYDALKAAPQVRALASIEERHTIAGKESWSGFYLHARHTYLEFFGDAALPQDAHVGDCGIGLAVEVPGGAAAVAERLRTKFGDQIEIDKQVRTTAAGEIPWYLAVDVKTHGPQVLGTWVMEVDSGYLSAMHPASPVAHPLSRQQYNSWDFRSDQLLDDVVGLTLALSSDKTSELSTQLGLMGWSIRRSRADVIATGPDVTIRIVPAGAMSGIQEAELRLRHPVRAQTVRLGNVELHLAGKSGHLIFWALP
jgi:Family of unknown function (DUF5829)